MKERILDIIGTWIVSVVFWGGIILIGVASLLAIAYLIVLLVWR